MNKEIIPTKEVDVSYPFDVEHPRGHTFEYPDATLENINAIVDERGTNDPSAVCDIANILEQYSLDGKQFYQLSERPVNTDFTERQTLTAYVRDTSRLIHEIQKNHYDSMIYLDKSGRPASRFVREFWDQFASKDEPEPTTNFVNIDRVSILRRNGYSVTEFSSNEDIKDMTSDLLRNKDTSEDATRIRALFTSGSVNPENIAEAFNQPALLDGKNICIIDEVKSSGSTLRLAEDLIGKAFPDSTVNGDYFWHQGHINGRGHSVPIWYESSFSTGRGVGDPDESYYRIQHENEPSQASLKRVVGAFALSAPHHVKLDEHTTERYTDEAYKLYVEDIKTLAECELFGDPTAFDDEIKTRTTNLFYKKLSEMGYDGPAFSEDAIKDGLFYGGKAQTGYLAKRKKDPQYIS